MSPAPPILSTVHLQVAVTAAGLHTVHLLLALVLLPSAESDAHEVDIAAVLDHLLSVPRHVSHLSCHACHGNFIWIGDPLPYPFTVVL